MNKKQSVCFSFLRKNEIIPKQKIEDEKKKKKNSVPVLIRTCSYPMKKNIFLQ